MFDFFMDTGNLKEYVTLYIKPHKTFTPDDCPGIRLTRRMAFALMKELEGRLFGDGEVDSCGVIKEKPTDYCFKTLT